MFIDAMGNWTRMIDATMRLWPTIIEYSSIVLVMACAMVAPDVRAQGTQRSTRSISSSETNSLEIFKDLNRLDVKEDGLNILDEELSKSLLPFANQKDSVVPSGFVSPRLPVVKSRRSKDELEKSKGWIWDAEEAVSGSIKNDDDSVSEVKSDKRKLSWDDFAKQTRRERQQKPDYHSSDRDSDQSESTTEDDSSLPEGLREVAKGLRSQRDAFGGIFGSRRSGSVGGGGLPVDSQRTPHQIEAQKAYMDEFQKILSGPAFDDSVSSHGGGSGDFFKAAIGPVQAAPMGGLDSLPAASARSRPTAVTQSLTPPVLAPATLPDVNATVLNQWNPMYTPLKPELPKPAPFFPTPIEVPRRRF